MPIYGPGGGSGGGGTVTKVVAGSGLSGGTITTAGTLSLAAPAAGVVSSNGVKLGTVTIGSGLTFDGTTLTATSGGGTVTKVSTGGLLTGGPITGSGTITFTAPSAGVVYSDGSTLAPLTIGTGLKQSAGTLSNTGVTSVAIAAPAIFSVTNSPVTTTGTLTLTAAGTSGGVPYFDGSTSLASSAALTASALVLGGGATKAPTTPVGLGTSTQLLHGNASGAPTWSAVSLTADVIGTLPVANGGIGATSLSAVFVGRKGSATIQLVGNGAVLTANTFYFTINAPVGFTINSLTAQCGAGSFTANVKVGSTSVTGLSAVAISTTPATTNATAANTVAAADVITVVVTAPSGSPTDAVLTLNFTYT